MRQSMLDIINSPAAHQEARGYNEKEEGIVFATDISQKRPTVRKTTPRDVVPFVRVRIGSIAAQKAGFVAGDKVALEWDKESRLGFIVRNDDGRVLTGLKRTKEDGKPVEGSQPLQLRFTWKKGIPSIHEPKLCREVVVINGDLGDNTIQFVFPEGTSFGGLSTPPKSEEDEPTGQVLQYNRRSTDRVAVA